MTHQFPGESRGGGRLEATVIIRPTLRPALEHSTLSKNSSRFTGPPLGSVQRESLMRFVRAVWKLLVGIKDALVLILLLLFFEIGRASCRERVLWYV